MELRSILVTIPIVMAVSVEAVMTRQKLVIQQNLETVCQSLLHFNSYYYLLQEKFNISGIPADMSVHWKTGNIFFTQISEDMKMKLQVMRPTSEIETIKVTGLGQSTTVDNLNDIIYLATDNGVYKYKDDNSVELYTALGEDVMYMAVSNDGSTMYIATWPQNRVHKITNDGQKQETFSVIPNGHGLTVDTWNNIYFVATKTSYMLKNGYNIPIKIKGLPNDKVTGIFVSRSDEVFAMDEDSNIYSVDPDSTSAKFLGSFSVSGVNTFALDPADNVLVGVKGTILKYIAYEKNPCTNIPTTKVTTSAVSSTEKTVKKGKRHSKKRKTTTTSTTESNDDYEEDDER